MPQKKRQEMNLEASHIYSLNQNSILVFKVIELPKEVSW